MLNLLRQWLKNIVVVMVLVAYIKFLLPKGQLKSYTRLVLSLMVMLIIIQPVVWLIRGSDNLIEELNSVSSWFEVREERADVRVGALQNDELVVEVYKQELAAKLLQDIEESTGQRIEKMEIEIEEDAEKDSFGYVKHLSLVFAKPESVPLSGQPIRVDLQQSTTTVNELSEQESLARQEVKAILSYKYGVKDAGISIKFIN